MTYEEFRAWTYRVVTAAGIVLLFYGVVSESEWAAWTSALTTLLGSGLAAANAPQSPAPRHRLEDS